MMTLKQQIAGLKKDLSFAKQELYDCRMHCEGARIEQQVNHKETVRLKVERCKLDAKYTLDNTMKTYRDKLSDDVQAFVKATLVLLDK